MPDGQGQTSNIDIGSIDHVDVLRGPFSALYGNASGSMINVETQTGQQPATLEASSGYSSFGSWCNSVKVNGATGDDSHAGDMNYTVSASRLPPVAIAITARHKKSRQRQTWCAH